MVRGFDLQHTGEVVRMAPCIGLALEVHFIIVPWGRDPGRVRDRLAPRDQAPAC